MDHANQRNRSHQRMPEGPRTVLGDLRAPERKDGKKLEIVLKCDSIGSVEAVEMILAKLKVPGVQVRVIHSGVGAVGKSDLMMALNGSRLVVGFNVGVMPKLEQWLKEHGVEVRLYQVIYKLVDDIRKTAESLTAPEPEEKVTGRAKVIALFKSAHKSIILGCEVLEGVISIGSMFRVISAMGPIYVGRVASLHIQQDAVKEARAGRQVGIKIAEFSQARIGDQVECFEKLSGKKHQPWRPVGEILHFKEQ